jgi:hypothetical protein
MRSSKSCPQTSAVILKLMGEVYTREGFGTQTARCREPATSYLLDRRAPVRRLAINLLGAMLMSDKTVGAKTGAADRLQWQSNA